MNILNQERLKKSLAVIVSLVLIIALPIGTVRVYADTPTPIDLDNIEESEGVADVVYGEDIIKQKGGINFEKLFIPLKDEPTVIEVATPAELETALASTESVYTIKLSENIEYNKGIVIDGKTVTFDVGNFNLDVKSSGASGLEVKNGGHVYLDGNGHFNVSHSGSGNGGVVVRENSSATVSNVKSTYGTGIGVYADGDGASLRVLGNVEVVGSNATGAKTWGKASIIIDGTVTGGSRYVNLDMTVLQKNDGINDPSSEALGIVWIKKLMVCEIEGKGQYDNLPDAIAAVDEGQTIRLLADINLEKGIDNAYVLTINGKKFTIDLDGHKLSVINLNPFGKGIELLNNALLQIIGEGEFKIISNSHALYLNDSQFNSQDTVNVLLKSSNHQGIYTDSSTVSILKGEVEGGIYATINNTITLGGAVIADMGEGGSFRSGVRLNGKGNTVRVAAIEVRSGDMDETSYGIYMVEGGTVTVGSEKVPGNVIGVNSGIFASQGSERAHITVYGDVEGGAHGILVYDDAEVKVYGNVKSTSSNKAMWGVESRAGKTDSQSNQIEIHGNVQGPNGLRVYGASGLATVTGNVTATGTTSDYKGVEASNGSAEIYGNVIAPSGIGAEAGTNGQITIDGDLSGKIFAKVGGIEKKVEHKTIPTTKDFYNTYSEGSSVVWVKEVIDTKYTLTVEKGNGDGDYTANTVVNIQADPAPEGKVFDRWLSSDGGSFADANSPNTTFTMPAKAVTVTATYKDKELPQAVYTITASANSGGTITPSGNIKVAKEGSQTFTIEAKNGYRISSVLVDGVDKGAISTYTFSNITGDHTIVASFTRTSSGGGGGGSSRPSLRIDSENPPAASVGTGYSHTFKISGGSPPYTFEVINGTLPEGLSLSKEGILSGTTNAEGTFTFTIKVKDSAGRTANRNFTWIANPPVTDSPAKRITILTVDIPEASIDQQRYHLEAAPFINPEAGRTLVPIRFISEALGADVKWNPETRQVTIIDNDTEIILSIGSQEVWVDGIGYTIDCAPVIVPPGRTFVPLRFINEILGATVEYDDETKQIMITR